jgi:hypothetical protein
VAGTASVDALTVTAVSAVTLDGPNVTVALASELVIVPPFVGETTVGGESPLAVFAFGSGVVVVVPVGVVVEPEVAGSVVVPPTTTEIVPSPEVVPAAGGVALVPLFCGGVVPVASVVPVEVVVAGGVVVVPLVSPATAVDPFDVEEPVELPAPLVPVVVAGGGVMVVSPG